jgi:hypothetical protein
MTFECPGCGDQVDVTRVEGTPLIVERQDDGGRPVCSVRVGRTEVHRCDPDRVR